LLTEEAVLGRVIVGLEAAELQAVLVFGPFDLGLDDPQALVCDTGVWRLVDDLLLLVCFGVLLIDTRALAVDGRVISFFFVVFLVLDFGFESGLRRFSRKRVYVPKLLKLLDVPKGFFCLSLATETLKCGFELKPVANLGLSCSDLVPRGWNKPRD